MVRHGETQYNAEGRAIGHTNVPLTAVGREQARSVAQALGPLAPTALYTSPLTRALETATVISQTLGLGFHRRDGLMEASIGALEGLDPHEMWERHPDFMRL